MSYSINDYISGLTRNEPGTALQRLHILRQAGQVQRCHVIPMLQRRNVAEHVWNAQCIAFMLAEINKIDAAPAIMKLMFHDAAEVVSGDIPASAKWMQPSLREGDRAIEEEFLSVLRLKEPWRVHLRANNLPAPGINDFDLDIASAADMLEFLMHCLEERRRGNREYAVETCFTRALTYMSKFGHVIGVAGLVGELAKEWDNLEKGYE